MAQNGQLFGVLDHSKHSEELIIKCCRILTLLFFLLYTMAFSRKFVYWDATLICISNVTHHLFLVGHWLPKIAIRAK